MLLRSRNIKSPVKMDEDHHSVVLLQRVHDLCLVWTPQIRSFMAAVESHPGVLADCLAGVLPSGTRQSLGFWHIHRLPAEDRARGHYGGGLHRLRHHLPEGENGVELR